MLPASNRGWNIGESRRIEGGDRGAAGPPGMAGLNRAINAGSTFCGAQASMVAIHGRIHKYFTVIALRITPMSHKIM